MGAGEKVGCGAATDRLRRRALVLRSVAFGAAAFGSAGLKPCATYCADRDSHQAPTAATTFNATPTQVVAFRPSAGMSQKPAATAPIAAPTVFAAYKAAAELRAAVHAAAMGNVAPMAAAGMPTSVRLIRTRRSAKRVGAVPSAYAQARTGTVASSAKGSVRAQTAIAISSAA